MRETVAGLGDVTVLDEEVAEVIEGTLTVMELDLQVARAAVAVRRAATAEAVQRPLTDLGLAIRRWGDELAVQSRLGGMDLDDRIGEVFSRLERAASSGRAAASRAGEELGEDLEELREAALDTLHDTRRVLGELVGSLRR